MKAHLEKKSTSQNSRHMRPKIAQEYSEKAMPTGSKLRNNNWHRKKPQTLIGVTVTLPFCFLVQGCIKARSAPDADTECWVSRYSTTLGANSQKLGQNLRNTCPQLPSATLPFWNSMK